MKNFRNVALVILVISTVVIISLCTYYNFNISKVSDDDTSREVIIDEGSISDIAVTLKENNLIRNITVFKIYVKLNNKMNLKAGTYMLSENMGVGKIVDILKKGSNINPNEISITFKEGINIRKIALIISEETNNSFDDVIDLVSDSSYIDDLINKYWFLTDDIKNKDIYYPLEGYLFPNTYRFTDKDVKVSEIFTKMLDETDKQLSKYRKEIENNDLSIHEILTLASITELEGAKANDRKDIAGVFVNRLNSSSFATLGSDATVYYASKIDDWTIGLTEKDLSNCSNRYNTNSRCSSNVGLPVGPICNPSIESIEASINPGKNDYYYFVTDCNGDLYMSKTLGEHNNTINKLIRENNWCA